ncbi:MAG TPA: WXG100 family type VII secretion target [Pseudonocardiaceae bacterium]
MSSPTVYDYAVLDQFVSDLSKAANQINDEIQNMIKQTQQTYGEYFVGSAADDFVNRANKISQLLTQQIEQLMNVAKTTGNGAQNMQNADQQGAKLIAG